MRNLHLPQLRRPRQMTGMEARTEVRARGEEWQTPLHEFSRRKWYSALGKRTVNNIPKEEAFGGLENFEVSLSQFRPYVSLRASKPSLCSHYLTVRLSEAQKSAKSGGKAKKEKKVKLDFLSLGAKTTAFSVQVHVMSTNVKKMVWIRKIEVSCFLTGIFHSKFTGRPGY